MFEKKSHSSWFPLYSSNNGTHVVAEQQNKKKIYGTMIFGGGGDLLRK